MKRQHWIYRYLIILIIASFIAAPVCAKVNFIPQVLFDSTGESTSKGEEIQISLQVDPGESSISNLQVEIIEKEALIDDTSFEHTTRPAGASIDFTRNGHLFSIDRLNRGESITISFNAYPTTLMKKNIDAVSVKLSYTQLGERIEEWKTVSVNTEDSYYHKWVEYKDTYEQTQSGSSLFFNIGIILSIIGIGMIGYTLYTRKSESSRASDIIIRYKRDMNSIKDELNTLYEANDTDEMQLRTGIGRIRSNIDRQIRTIGRR